MTSRENSLLLPSFVVKDDDDAGVHVPVDLCREVPPAAGGTPGVRHRSVVGHPVAGHHVEAPVGEGGLGAAGLPAAAHAHGGAGGAGGAACPGAGSQLAQDALLEAGEAPNDVEAALVKAPLDVPVTHQLYPVGSPLLWLCGNILFPTKFPKKGLQLQPQPEVVPPTPCLPPGRPHPHRHGDWCD